MKTALHLTAGIFLLAASNLSAALLFVSTGSINPTPPYNSWNTAAHTIQDAVTAASPNDVVLVTNGAYAGGLVLAKPVWVLGVGRAQFTLIDGGGTNRCVWMTNGARLEGFTLTNGWAQNGGGVWCSSSNAYVTNCVIVGNSAAGGEGGGVWGGTIDRSTLSSNSAGSGGGAVSATLNNCVLTGNSATSSGGGGTFQCNLNNCVLTGNSGNAGGGAFGGTLNNCTVSGNSANSGGGAQSADLNNCIVYFNSAPSGTNAISCTFNYCCTTPLPSAGAGNIDLDPRFVDLSGGNFRLQSSSPCINAGNNALVADPTGLDPDRNPRIAGGRVDMGAYEFQSPDSAVIVAQPLSQTVYAGSPVSITASADGAAPLFWQWYFNGNAIQGATDTNLTLTAVTTNQAGAYSVVVTNYFGSDTSHVAMLTVVDAAPSITQQPLSQVVSIGSYVTLTVGAEGSLPLFWQWRFNGAAISDATNSSLSLGPLTSDQVGAYSVIVSNSLGHVPSDDATLTLATSATRYVWQNSPSPTAPYTSWTTAAHAIQDAVNASVPGDPVMVTNGVYPGGLTVDRPLALVSVNGPEFTVVDAGYALISCVSMTNGASLSGFTLTHGYGFNGGGVWCPTTNAFLTNCVIADNRAQSYGGGAYGVTLYNCTLAGNIATNGTGGAGYSTLINCTVSNNLAGGAAFCTLYNCLLTGNTQYGGGAVFSTLYNCLLTGNGSGGSYGSYYYWWGGGAAYSTLYNCTLAGNYFGAASSILYNCVVYDNPVSGNANYDPFLSSPSIFNYCCTSPMPTNGVGNITNAPLFVSPDTGDFHLQPASPCINAGNNAFSSGTTDLDGNPRIVGGTVDIGAFEFQGSGSVISYAWLQQYGLPTDGSADLIDTDGDGMNNWQEWICRTCPTNPLSVLRLLSAATAGGNVTVRWQSVAGVNYFLERSTSPTAWLTPTNTVFGGTNMVLVATNIVGQAVTTTCADTNATGAGPFFYRVGVKYP